MNRIHLSLDETNVKALLLMVKAASDITWTNRDTKEAMVDLAGLVQQRVVKDMPHLSKFIADKEGGLGEF